MSRWVQGICAVLLALGAVGGIYMTFHATFTKLLFGGLAATYGCIRLAGRCAYYAVTVRGNVNRDGY